MKTFKEYLIESPAAVAHQMGLQHMGYGRFGRNGEVSHISRMGKLVHISKVRHVQTLKDDQLKHLEHADDEVFNNSAAGTANVVDHINAIRHGDDRVKVSQKIDGSPSFVMGTHPETKKFFVASKSAFNKDPKINYTEADVDRNHGHAPGLAKKLKSLLKHGHKLGVKGIVQGDLLYDEEDKKDEGDKIHFKPNTINYSIDKNHPEGKKVARSKIGVAIHTEYHDGKAVLNPNIEVKSHPDVYNMSVAVDKEKMKFDHDKLRHHTSEIGKLMKQIPKEGWDAVSHEKTLEHVKTYINSKVRKGEGNYNHKELMDHIRARSQKEIDSVSTEKSKAAKTAKMNETLKHVHDNRAHFNNAFQIQHHINEAKHHIVDSLNGNQTFDHHYADGSTATPEGYVSIGVAGPIKFVNRSGFSRANFEFSANRNR